MTGSAASARAVADFLDMLSAERGAARNTLDAYARDLGDYVAALAEQGRAPLDATTQDIRDHLADLAEAGLKPASTARKLSAIRQFHRFLAAEERRADDPAVLLEGPRQGRRLPKILSVDEVDALLRVAREGLDDTARPAGERLRAKRAACLVEVLYAAGPARVRTGRAASVGGETGRKIARAGRRFSHGQGQGRARAPGAV